jgi:hypothetical protein
MQQKCCIAAEAAWGRTGHAVASSQLRITLAGLGAGRAPRRRGALLAGWGHRGVARAGGGGWHSLACASRRRCSKPSGSRPTPSLQVQPRVANGFQRPLALVDHLVQDPLPRVQVRVPDPVGVPRVELVDLRHSAGYRVRGVLSSPQHDELLVMRISGGVSGVDGIGHGKSGMGKPVPLFLRCQAARLRRRASRPSRLIPAATKAAPLGSGTAAMVPAGAL